MSDTFPPSGPTTLTQVIPAYLYQQYADDDNLQALIDALNTMTQQYITWFATIGLPVYTGAMIVGALLDWVATNLYGQPRPVLSSGTVLQIGPPATFAPATLQPAVLKTTTSPVFYSVDDDVYKRVLTWNFYKGDGRTFSIRWLKRRIARFLLGLNGTDVVPIDQTYNISVAFGSGTEIDIALLTSYPLSTIFKAAIDDGVLQLPFQFTYVVTI